MGAAGAARETAVIALAGGVSYVDLRFGGMPRIIATAVLHGPGGVALVDPGPSSTLPTLRATLDSAGIRVADLTTLFLTHIHLDHAGGSGTLVRENPRLRVFVHEKGAPHLADPAKLLASAARLYGDAMDRLWGECRPVPTENLVVLAGGEKVAAGGRSLDVAYTPGHASHHVSYLDAAAGVAFVGDTAGIRIGPDAPILPATPPPDVDMRAWKASLAQLGAWRAETLFLSHFGPSSPTAAHLADFSERLDELASLAKRSLDHAGTDDDREAWFIEQVRRQLRRTADEADARACEMAGRLDLSWKGLARYWRSNG